MDALYEHIDGRIMMLSHQLDGIVKLINAQNTSQSQQQTRIQPSRKARGGIARMPI
jgi:hypothetical protein